MALITGASLITSGRVPNSVSTFFRAIPFHFGFALVEMPAFTSLLTRDCVDFTPILETVSVRVGVDRSDTRPKAKRRAAAVLAVAVFLPRTHRFVPPARTS